MNKYYLTKKDQQVHELHAMMEETVAQPSLPGYFRLFNRDDETTLHVRIVSEVANRAVWVVECEAKDVPPYFYQVLRPVEDAL